MERNFSTFDPSYLPYSHTPADESIQVHDARSLYTTRRHGRISAGTSSPVGFDLGDINSRAVGSSFHPHMNENQMNPFVAQPWSGLAMDPSYLHLGLPTNGVGHAGIVRSRSSTSSIGYQKNHAGQDYAACDPHCDEECRSQCGEAGELDVCEDPHCDALALPCTKEDCKVPTCDDAECLASSEDVDQKAAAAALASIVASQAGHSPSMDSQQHVSHLSAHAHSTLNMSSPTVAVNTLMGASHGGQDFTASEAAHGVMFGQSLNFSNMSLFPTGLGIQLDLLGDAVMYHLPTSAPHTRPCLWDNQAAMSQDTCRLCEYPYYGYRQLVDHFQGAHTQLFNSVKGEVLQHDSQSQLMTVGHVDPEPEEPVLKVEETPEASQERAETVTPSAAPSPLNSETTATRNSVESVESPSITGPLTCRWQISASKVCGQIFDFEEDLHRHAMEHGKELKKPEPLRCLWEDCTREAGERGIFSQRSKLDRHLQTHTGYKPFKCDVCGLPLSGAQSLTQHKRTHTNETPWVCSFEGCGKSFKAQSALTMHERTHTGEKSLLCPICGKAFSESSNLSKHKKTHARQFQCNTCGKNFSRHDHLRIHMRVHEGKTSNSASAATSTTTTPWIKSEGPTSKDPGSQNQLDRVLGRTKGARVSKR